MFFCTALLPCYRLTGYECSGVSDKVDSQCTYKRNARTIIVLTPEGVKGLLFGQNLVG